MLKKIGAFGVVVTVLAGCASVPTVSDDKDMAAKQFNPPSEGKAGLYIYRNSFIGAALKKDVWVNDECIGETAPNVYFYHEVDGDKEHKVSTESEFSPNDLVVKAKAGMQYFIRQYIKMGVFVGGAGLELIDEEKGKKDVAQLSLAVKGTCSK